MDGSDQGVTRKPESRASNEFCMHLNGLALVENKRDLC